MSQSLFFGLFFVPSVFFSADGRTDGRIYDRFVPAPLRTLTSAAKGLTTARIIAGGAYHQSFICLNLWTKTSISSSDPKMASARDVGLVLNLGEATIPFWLMFVLLLGAVICLHFFVPDDV